MPSTHLREFTVITSIWASDFISDIDTLVWSLNSLLKLKNIIPARTKSSRRAKWGNIRVSLTNFSHLDPYTRNIGYNILSQYSKVIIRNKGSDLILIYNTFAGLPLFAQGRGNLFKGHFGTCGGFLRTEYLRLQKFSQQHKKCKILYHF